MSTTLDHKVEKTFSQLKDIEANYSNIHAKISPVQRTDLADSYIHAIRKGVEFSSRFIQEIADSPTAYNFNFLMHLIKNPSAVASEVPQEFKNTDLKPTQKLYIKYFAEHLFSRSPAINFN